MNNIATKALTILFIAVFVVICLAIDYVIRKGFNKSFDKIHNTRKHRKAAAQPGGRFRLADRYRDGGNVVAKGEKKKEKQAAPNVIDNQYKSTPSTVERELETDSVSANEWELESDSVSDDEWELEEETKPVTKSASQPDPQSVPKSASRPSPQSGSHLAPTKDPSPAASPKPEKPQEPAKASRIDIPVFDIPETVPPFQENRCCICNGELYGKYAVLFQTDSGAEARIDRDCAMKFNTIIKGDDPQEIVDAGRYLLSRYNAVDPTVAPYLKKYAKVASDRLKQWRGTE